MCFLRTLDRDIRRSSGSSYKATQKGYTESRELVPEITNLIVPLTSQHYICTRSFDMQVNIRATHAFNWASQQRSQLPFFHQQQHACSHRAAQGWIWPFAAFPKRISFSPPTKHMNFLPHRFLSFSRCLWRAHRSFDL